MFVAVSVSHMRACGLPSNQPAGANGYSMPQLCTQNIYEMGNENGATKSIKKKKKEKKMVAKVVS